MKLVNKIFILVFALLRLSWFKTLNKYNKRSVNVIWLIKNYSLKSFFNNDFLNDLALLNAVVNTVHDYRVVLGPRIGGFTSSNIFYNISRQLNYFNLSGDSLTLHHIVSNLELQGNLCMPSSDECRCWENKYEMYNLLISHEIAIPNSTVVLRENVLEALKTNYPKIIKNGFLSGGEGVFSVESDTEAQSVLNNPKLINCKLLIIQDRVNMRKDIRVIVIGKEVVLHYWRLNTANEWKKTSTSSGSNVDFEYIPTYLSEYLIEATLKLGWSSAAYDVAYNNDNSNSQPLILEVSAAFMPNPPVRYNYRALQYSKYKTSLRTFLIYNWDYVKVNFTLKSKLVDYQVLNNVLR